MPSLQDVAFVTANDAAEHPTPTDHSGEPIDVSALTSRAAGRPIAPPSRPGWDRLASCSSSWRARKSLMLIDRMPARALGCWRAHRPVLPRPRRRTGRRTTSTRARRGPIPGSESPRCGSAPAGGSERGRRVLPRPPRQTDDQGRNPWSQALSGVVGVGVDPTTSRFSGARSTN